MPLHDGSDRPEWTGMRHLWITELLHWVKPRLPAGFRACIGTSPLLAVGAPAPARGRLPAIWRQPWLSAHPCPRFHFLSRPRRRHSWPVLSSTRRRA
jgi:hypothetical protein